MKLSALQTANQHFTISAFDHRSSLISMLGLDQGNEQELTERMIMLKSLFMKVFSPLSSAVLTDPLYGKVTLEECAEGCGILLSLEESTYDSPKSAVPTLLSNWGIEGVKGYGAAAKLLVYFHPDEELAAAKTKQIEQLYEDAKRREVPFLVEPVIYDPNSSTDFKKNWHDIQLQTVEMLDDLCDVLKIEYPGLYASSESEAAQYCQEISHASRVPWIVLSRGMEYELFENAVKVSKRSGSAGFAVGRAVWQEIEEFSVEKTGSFESTVNKIEHFLYSIGVERLKKLIQIVEG